MLQSFKLPPLTVPPVYTYPRKNIPPTPLFNSGDINIRVCIQMKRAIQPSLKNSPHQRSSCTRSKALFKSANKNKGPWAGIIKNSQQKPCCHSHWSFEGFLSLFFLRSLCQRLRMCVCVGIREARNMFVL